MYKVFMAVNKELMKGCTETLVLTVLTAKQMYGYEIIKELESISNGVFELREGTLYPILHSLEADGFVSSKWVGAEGSRQRKYYFITKGGKAALKDKASEWSMFKVAMDQVLKGLKSKEGMTT